MFGSEVDIAAMGHAKSCYPEESCGLVIGGTYYPTPNVSERTLSAYVIDPEAYILLSQKGDIQAVIHSHPRAKEDRNGEINIGSPSKLDMVNQLAQKLPYGIVVCNGVDAALPPFWFGDQVPIPPLINRKYRHGVLDCYSLVRDWYRLNWDLTIAEVPRQDGWWLEGEDLYAEGFERIGFEKISKSDMEVGDSILCSVMPPGYKGVRISNHSGIYVGRGQWMHHLWSGYKRDVVRLSKKEPVGPWTNLATHYLRYVG